MKGIKILLLGFVLLAGFRGLYAQTTPPLNENPPWVSPHVKIYVDSPLEIAVVNTAMYELTDIMRSRVFKTIAMIVVIFGLLISVAQSWTSGSALPTIFYLFTAMIIYFISTVGTNRMQVVSYSYANNWDAQNLNIAYQPKPVPLIIYFGAGLASYISGFFTYIADHSMAQFSGMVYQQYPHTLAESLDEVFKADVGDYVSSQAIKRYIDGCLAPEIAREVRQNGSVLSNDINDIITNSEDLLIVDEDSKQVMSCGEYYRKWRSILEQNIDVVIAQTNQKLNATGQSALGIEIARKVQAVEKGLQGTGTTWKNIFFSVKMLKLLKDEFSNIKGQTQLYEGSGPVMRFITKIASHLSEWISEFFGRIIGSIALRIYPYLSAYAFAIVLFAFPVIVIFALLPGGARVLLDYFRTYLWVQSWLPFAVLVKQLTNIFVKMNLVNKAISAGSQGMINLNALHYLSMTKGFALAIGGIMLLSVPVITYGIFARGSLSGLLMGLGFSVSQIAQSGIRTITGITGSAASSITGGISGSITSAAKKTTPKGGGSSNV